MIPMRRQPNSSQQVLFSGDIDFVRLRKEIIGKRVKTPHCPATVNGDESRNNATDAIGKARRVK